MKTCSVISADLARTFRFDAKYHFSHQDPVLSRIKQGHWQLANVADALGRDHVWMPGRFARVWAQDEAYGKALLSPYDNFRFLPWSRSYLSKSQVREYPTAEVSRGTMLIVRSGRNCGPVTMVDSFIEQFVVSDDMIRITGGASDDLFYLYAFLSSQTGQDLIRRDRNGSVIDHLGPDQVADLRYPLVDQGVRQQSVLNFRRAFEVREQARLILARLRERYLAFFGLAHEGGSNDQVGRCVRYEVGRHQIHDRFDAEPLTPRYAQMREQIRAVGGQPLSELATVRKPPSRYKTTYVEDERFGIPLLSGRHIAQYKPIALRYMNISGFRDPDIFRISRGMTLLTADGRAEENLADCVLVSGDREGWGASGHVHRVSPHPGVSPGLIYLALSCAPVQAQLKALATGSVVDALSEEDVRSVVIPYSSETAAMEIGAEAETAWTLFAEASALERSSVQCLDAELGSGLPS